MHFNTFYDRKQIMRIDIINGPNLNMLGTREPEIYGSASLADIEQASKKHGEALGFEINFVQSNSETALIDAVQQAHKQADGIIINGAGYSHSSVSLLDALLGGSKPIVEVHLSNIFARESFRHTSLLAPAAKGMICGFGAKTYLLALDALADLLEK